MLYRTETWMEALLIAADAAVEAAAAACSTHSDHGVTMCWPCCAVDMAAAGSNK
jgi:hypothetical protein